MSERIDCAVIGAGVVGLAVARELALARREVIILEAEDAIGTHTSSRNSEVIHAGIYYPTHSLKARFCVEGKHLLYAYCREREIPHRQTGKVIVATDESEREAVGSYIDKAAANGVDDLRLLSAQEMSEMEPALKSVAGVFSPSTGIIDSHALMLSLQGDAENAGGMAAIVGSDLETIEAITSDWRANERALWVANVNAPGQVVVAGAAKDIASLAEQARELGLRRVVPLKVSGAFHTPLMAGAQAELDTALATERFVAGSFPIWTNLYAAPAEDTAAALSGQLVGRVRFSESLLAMSAAGAEAFVHIGPGDVTAGMAKRTAKGATVITVSSLEDIGPAVERLAVV